MKVYVAMLFVDYGMCSECEYRLEEVKTFKNKEDAVNWQKEKGKQVRLCRDTRMYSRIKRLTNN